MHDHEQRRDRKRAVRADDERVVAAQRRTPSGQADGRGVRLAAPNTVTRMARAERAADLLHDVDQTRTRRRSPRARHRLSAAVVSGTKPSPLPVPTQHQRTEQRRVAAGGGELGQPEQPERRQRDADDHQRLGTEPLDQKFELACDEANSRIVIGRNARPVWIGV